MTRNDFLNDIAKKLAIVFSSFKDLLNNTMEDSVKHYINILPTIISSLPVEERKSEILLEKFLKVAVFKTHSKDGIIKEFIVGDIREVFKVR